MFVASPSASDPAMTIFIDRSPPFMDLVISGEIRPRDAIGSEGKGGITARVGVGGSLVSLPPDRLTLTAADERYDPSKLPTRGRCHDPRLFRLRLSFLPPCHPQDPVRGQNLRVSRWAKTKIAATALRVATKASSAANGAVWYFRSKQT